MDSDQLHAYIDGQIAGDERRAIAEELARDPDMAARARDYAEQIAGLHTLFDPVLEEPHQLRVPVDRQAGRWSRWGGMAAALVLGVCCGFVARGAFTGSAPSAAPIARAASLAHAAYVPEVRHPVEVAAADESHLVAWLSKRLATPLKAPSLAAAGYQLLGGRLLPPTQYSDPAPMALLMYENPQGKRLTLLIKREASNAETAFSFSDDRGTRVFYWIDGPLGYALAGDLPKDELQRVAELVYQQLNP